MYRDIPTVNKLISMNDMQNHFKIHYNKLNNIKGIVRN